METKVRKSEAKIIVSLNLVSKRSAPYEIWFVYGSKFRGSKSSIRKLRCFLAYLSYEFFEKFSIKVLILWTANVSVTNMQCDVFTPKKW